MRRRIYVNTVLVSLLSFTTPAFACVGARPMAMGGAFIAVSDDANATYWNPAGLSQLEDLEITYTPTLYNRDEVSYDDFVSFVSPLKIGRQDLGGLGLSFINSGYDFSPLEKTIDRWYWLSYGVKTFDNLSLGTNLRLQCYEEKSLGLRDDDSTFAVDLALLWKLNKLSFGILWQDMNEPEVELFGAKAKFMRNLRPGIAFRPDEKTTIALDMYDAIGESKGKPGSAAYDLRLGIERWFDLPEGTSEWLGSNFALRLGGYHINRGDRVFTFGFGLKGSSENNLLKNVQLDYALLYWTDTSSGTNKFTHQLGISFKF